MNTPEEKPQENNKGAFIKAMIKISNPSWSEEQIEAELQKKLIALDNPDSNEEGCDMCSG